MRDALSIRLMQKQTPVVVALALDARGYIRIER